MTPSTQAKAAGLNSLAELSQITHMPVSTLKDWFRNYPKRFEFICKGAVLFKEQSSGEKTQ